MIYKEEKQKRREIYEELKLEFEKENFETREKLQNVFRKYQYDTNNDETIQKFRIDISETLGIPLESIKKEVSSSGLSTKLSVNVNNKYYEILL